MAASIVVSTGEAARARMARRRAAKVANAEAERAEAGVLLDSGEAKIAKMVKLLLSLSLIAPAAAFLSTSSHARGSHTQVFG